MHYIILDISTQITSSHHIFNVAESVMSRSRTISPASGPSISATVSGTCTRTSTCRNFPSRIWSRSSTYLLTARNARLDTRSTILVAWAERTVRRWNRNGRTSTSRPSLHERWDQARDTPRSTTVGEGGTGRNSSGLVGHFLFPGSSSYLICLGQVHSSAPTSPRRMRWHPYNERQPMTLQQLSRTPRFWSGSAWFETGRQIPHAQTHMSQTTAVRPSFFYHNH